MTRPFPCFTHPFLWISAVLFFSQCSRSDNVDNPPVPPDPDKPFLTITQALPAAPFGAQGGSAVLIFSTNEPWRITSETAPESAIDAATWYDIAPPSGDAGGEINVTVKVDPNEEYVGRCFTLILRGETLEERIEVSQAKKNAIIAGDNRLEIGSEERTLTVEVQSNVDYTVSVKEGGEWIEELPESRAAPGLEERTHRFTISANPDARERTGLIVFKDKASDLFDELTVVQAAWDDPDPERSALRAFYDAAEGGGWTHRENWCSDKPLGAWYGVETDDEGHVTALRLPRNNLAGTIPEKIGKLTHLRHLDLSWNGLEGELTYKNKVTYEIESYLDDLLELETIDLSHNRLTSRFMPGAWYRMEGLRTVDLSCNRLEGFAFPLLWEKMFENGRYVDLILNDNYLWDTTPEVIQNHPKWSRLALQVIRQYYSDGDHGMGGSGIKYDVPVYLPDFTFTDLRDGTQQSIRDVYSANELTMLFHWDPMQEESATFMTTVVRRFHTLFSGQGFAVVAILPQGEEYRRAAESYLAGHEVPWPVVSEYADAEGHRTVLPSSPYPSYQLVDRSGMVTVDMFSGASGPDWIFPESDLVDFMAQPLQHTDYLNGICKKIFGNSEYQSTDFTMDKKFETLQTATKGKGIDLVLMGDAFTDIDIETGFYKQLMEFAMESFFTIEPTKSYREYFNVYMVYAVSRDAYIGEYPDHVALGTITDRYHGLSNWLYTLSDYAFLPIEGVNIPSVSVVVNGINDGVTYMEAPLQPGYAFSGYPPGGRSALRWTLLHEFTGHAFGLLGDEYFSLDFAQIPQSEKRRLESYQHDGQFLNLSLTDDPKSVYWAHLIGHPQYPYVGIHKGGFYYFDGVWKSESTSAMEKRNCSYFNAICRELLVKRILELSGEGYTFEKFLAKDSDVGRPGSAHSALQSASADLPYKHHPPIFR